MTYGSNVYSFWLSMNLPTVILLMCCLSLNLFASDQSQYQERISKLVDKEVFEVQAVYHIGDVICENKKVSVVAVRKVIKGMLAPRGAHAIFLFDQDKLVGIHEEAAFPLRCDGSKVYFFGEIQHAGVDGASLDFKDGFEKRQVTQ